MNLNKHLDLKGKHFEFGGSNYSWLNYSEEKVVERIHSEKRKELGTELHEFAAQQIRLHHLFTTSKEMRHSFESFIDNKYYDEEKEVMANHGSEMLVAFSLLPREVIETIKAYIKDAIDNNLEPERVVCYDKECAAGTADSIGFRNNTLIIHDLKTGSTPAHIEQLEIYAAFYCLEYHIDPSTIDFKLCIYQNGEALCHSPSSEEIKSIMETTMRNVAIYHRVVG